MQLPSLVTAAISSDSHSTLEFCSEPPDSSLLTAKHNLDRQQMEFFFPRFNYFCGQSTLPQPHFDLLHLFLIRDKHASGAILQLFLSVGSQVVLLSCFLRTGLARLFQANWNYPLNSLGSLTSNMLKFSLSQRPYHVEYTSSRPITEVKQH